MTTTADQVVAWTYDSGVTMFAAGVLGIATVILCMGLIVRFAKATLGSF